MRFNRFSVWEKWKNKWQSDDDDGDDVNVKPSSGLQIWNESIFHTPISSFKCHANRHNCALYTFATQFSHIRDVAVAASSLALTHILTVEICVNVSPLWKFRMQKKNWRNCTLMMSSNVYDECCMYIYVRLWVHSTTYNMQLNLPLCTAQQGTSNQIEFITHLQARKWWRWAPHAFIVSFYCGIGSQARQEDGEKDTDTANMQA